MPLGPILLTVLLIGVCLLSIVATTTLCWMLYAWRDDASGKEDLSQQEFSRGGELSFSLIVPARHEELVLERTLLRLCETTHPYVEIVVVVGPDDELTREAAQRAADAFPTMINVVLDHSIVKSKPASLNTGLAACRGDVVGVFDAEDIVHPDLLSLVESRLISGDLDAIQCGVQLMNFWSSWFAVRNVLEYYFWFRSRLHFQASREFVPLGGNTVFVRRALLGEMDGWDPNCLAEDCDLGVRLSVAGARIGVAYDAALVTREEVPTSVREFVRQRTRWSQGFIQVYRKRDWARLPTIRRRLFARYILLSPLVQAFAGIVVPISIATAFAVQIPAGFALLTWLPTLPTVATVVVEVTMLGEFCRTFGGAVTTRDRLRLIVGAPFYQVLLAVAAIRAVWREIHGTKGWEKTHHIGEHMEGLEPAGNRVIVLPEAAFSGQSGVSSS
jgi:cellulose synthase/poly-beta-1,6-N-acetylglucosamine synthase-like glycosyltransferase